MDIAEQVAEGFEGWAEVLEQWRDYGDFGTDKADGSGDRLERVADENNLPERTVAAITLRRARAETQCGAEGEKDAVAEGENAAGTAIMEAADAARQDGAEFTSADAEGFRGDWTEPLVNGCTSGQLRALGCPPRGTPGWRRWMEAYNRGANAAVDYWVEFYKNAESEG